MFVGDSLQRGQWQSFVCMVEWMIPEDQKSLKRGRFHSVFTIKVPSHSLFLFSLNQNLIFFYKLRW